MSQSTPIRLALTLAVASATVALAPTEAAAQSATRPAPGTMRWVDMPERLPYAPGKPAPFGYHVEHPNQYAGVKFTAGACIVVGTLSMFTSAALFNGASDPTAGWVALGGGAVLTGGSLAALVALEGTDGPVFVRNDLAPGSSRGPARRARRSMAAAPVVSRDVRGIALTGRF